MKELKKTMQWEWKTFLKKNKLEKHVKKRGVALKMQGKVVQKKNKLEKEELKKTMQWEWKAFLKKKRVPLKM